jgi:DNA mismatch repair protein MSH3
MLTGSIPTHRLDIHVRRLLNAGHKVGIVRQIETAALKKVSENKSKPFTRALTSLYTSATFVDELGVDNSSLGGGNNSATLMCLVEESIGKEKVRLGLIAVVPSTGEVVWDGTLQHSFYSSTCSPWLMRRSNAWLSQNSKMV